MTAALSLAILGALTAFLARPPQNASAHGAPRLTLAGTAYGASHSRMKSAATAAAWPQQNSLWCGIATVAAIARYQGSTTATQSGVANYLNSGAAVSVWGTPSKASGYYGPGFRADVSRDFGTDPRSITLGLNWSTAGHYHQFVAAADPLDASIRLARDLERTAQPISVFVDHGLHSVVVSAVFSTTDPAINSSGITGFEVWDPGWSVPNAGIQPNEYEDVSLQTWTTNSLYWGSPYEVNLISGITYDPNPAVGPYRYDPAVAGHAATIWSGHYVYVRPDPIQVLSARASIDWVFNQNGQLIKGFSGEIAPGYLGSTALWQGATNKLGSVSAFGPAFSARGAYDRAAAGSSPAAALAFVGTDSAHSLNVRTTQDGLNYSPVLTLADSSNAAPAVLVIPPASAGGNNIVLLAWDGMDSAHSLHLLYDVYNVTGQTQTLTLSHGSVNAPSLAWFNGQVWLAWTGTDSAHTITIQAMGAQGVAPGALTALTSAPGASGGPMLANDPPLHSLLLTWVKASGGQMDMRSSLDGATWTVPANAGALGSASGGATMVASLAPIPGGAPGYPIASAYLVWRASSGDLTAQPFSATLAPGATQLAPASSPYAPAASYISGPDFMLVWTGTDQHVHVAQMQM